MAKKNALLKWNWKRAVLAGALIFVMGSAESCDSNGNGVGDTMDTFRKTEAQVLDFVGACTGVMQAVCAPNK